MIQVLHRAFDIVEFIAKNPDQSKSLSEISDHLNLHASTCATIIKTLVDRKYLEKLDNKKGYVLGSQLHHLTNFSGYKEDLVKVAKPVMEEIVKQLNENVLLAILDGSMRVAILRAQSKQDIQAIAVNEKAAYQTSSGRLLVAFLSEQELDRYLNRYGLPAAEEWKEASTQKTFVATIEKIKKDGFAIQESGEIVGIAVPVKKNAKVIASISIYLPHYRLEKLDKVILVKKMTAYADTISKQMSF